MEKEIRIFFTALMFYTRIPCPQWIGYNEEYLNKATRYFPLIGWMVGGLSALIFWSASTVFTKEISILLSMAGSVLITGAFHEDGFADVCDGFGGGSRTKEKILAIMKDSHIGAYGVIGICLLLLLKFFILLSIDTSLIPLVLIIAHALSRWCAITFIYTHKYVRENEESKTKPVIKNPSLKNLFIASVFGLLPFTLFQNYFLLLLIIPVYLAKYLLGRYFQKRIGGYTGDCLGATQQICEVVFYLSFHALWKFI